MCIFACFPYKESELKSTEHGFSFIYVGILKAEDGSVLKAMTKPLCGVREIEFYENMMSNSTDPSTKALRKLVPEYRGTIKMPFRGKAIDFIKLADITHDMCEPCVMDIKIGKRTWDPLATPEKITAEEQKYKACKQHLGFCIPGFQVHDIKTGDIRRFGKEYGKKLDQHSVRDGKIDVEIIFYRMIVENVALSIFSVENFPQCRYSAVQIAACEISVDAMVNSSLGSVTNIVAALFQLIAFGI